MLISDVTRGQKVTTYAQPVIKLMPFCEFLVVQTHGYKRIPRKFNLRGGGCTWTPPSPPSIVMSFHLLQSWAKLFSCRSPVLHQQLTMSSICSLHGLPLLLTHQ